MIKDNAALFADPNNVIDYVLNLAPHQSDVVSAPEGVDSCSIDHTWDMLSGNDMKNNTAFKTNTVAGSPGLAHQNKSFIKKWELLQRPF